MKKLLVLYPELFGCKSKFERKVSNITSNINNFDVIFPSDPNGFISEYFKAVGKSNSLICDPNWQNHEITHAIIFDDGEEFNEELEYFKSNNIPLRLIKITLTRVVNIKRDSQYQSKKSTPYYEYIGRGSLWGNPYSMYEKGDDRDEVIRKYKYDFDNNMFINKDKSDVYKLLGKRLGCFCKPAKCHGDILADYLNKYDDGK